MTAVDLTEFLATYLDREPAFLPGEVPEIDTTRLTICARMDPDRDSPFARLQRISPGFPPIGPPPS